MIYSADCHTLKKDQVTDVEIDDYFLWKERSLFDLKVSFQGQNVTTVGYGIDEAETITQSTTYEVVSAEVINNDRENKFPETKDDGTFEIKTSALFNPAGIYGKIKDSDLIRIQHNPCFGCNFTAWATFRRTQTNRLIIIRTPDEDPPIAPVKYDNSYDRWDIVRGPDLFYYDDGGEAFFGFLINAGQRFTQTLSLQIHPGFIDPEKRNVGEILTFSGWAEESENSPNAKIKIGNYEYNGFVNGLQDGITAQIEWQPKRQRPA